MPRAYPDFDQLIDRHNTGSVKWDRYRGTDIIPLWVADMDFAAPPAVLAALTARVAHGVFGYTHPPDQLLDAIMGDLVATTGWRIRREWVVWLPGLVTGLHLACRAVGAPGAAVLSPVPIYPPFRSAPSLSARQLIEVPLSVDAQGRYHWDLETLANKVTAESRLLLLCNPHNPVGRVFDATELSALAAFAERHNLIICSDEIHAGLVLEDGLRHIPIAHLDAAVAARTITLMAPSKTYNVPGLGFSFAIIPDPALRQAFRAQMKGVVPDVNLFGYVAALAAYEQGAEWHQALLTYLRGNRARLLAAIHAHPQLSVSPVEATYLAWIDARGLAVDPPQRAFEQAGLGVADGADFGAPGFVRWNFGCRRALLEEALTRLAALATGGA
ncbi:MAG: MalY/PatB family protein [Acidiferrobacter sp.]